MPADTIKVLVAQSDGLVLNEFMLGDGVYLIGADSTCQINVGSITDPSTTDRLRIHYGSITDPLQINYGSITDP